MPYRWRRQILSYNGTGTFVIDTAGTPYVTGTVISSTAANALNNDLATGLTTAITKDGQTTPTANIPLGNFKITNLGAGTVASDAARLSQVQNSGVTTLIAITGTDTITGTVTPTLTAYTAGQIFSFVVAATNTGAVTLNISSLGATAVTRTGAVALAAGDMVTGQVAIVEFDGTRFQLVNGNAYTNLRVSGTLGVTGVTTIAAGTALLPALTTTGDTNTGVWFPAADTIAASTGGTERIRVTSGGNFGIACTPSRRLSVQYDFAKTDTTVRAVSVLKSNDASNANEMLISALGAATQASRSWQFQTGEDGVSNLGTLSLQTSGGRVGIGTGVANYQLEVSTDSAGKPGVGGLWTVVSDERIKTDIIPANLDRCYEIVKSVPLKYFGFSQNVYSDEQITDRHNLGWVAQDVQKVFKNAVSVKPFTLKTGEVIEDCLDLNSGQMIAAMYGSVQALMQKVEDQAALIKTLADRIAALETA
jgi:hypothetical protein